MARPCIKLLSTSHLLHNIDTLKKRAAGSQLVAVIKTNAYGHGAVDVAQRLEGRVSFLAVSSLCEAVVLRKANIKTPILLLAGVFTKNELSIAEQLQCSVALHSAHQLEWIQQERPRLSVWIKINSGMTRLGFRPEDVPALYQKLCSYPTLMRPIRLLSHFSCADTQNHRLNQIQRNVMADIRQQIDAPISFCNSAAIFHFPECHYDYVRPGLALYGVSPISTLSSQDIDLKSVMTLSSQLIAVQTLKKGESVGYDARYTNTQQESILIGIVAMGYGDGYSRTARLGTPVLIRGKECPILGGVSMNMTIVDLRPCPAATVGEDVLFWGPSLPIERLVAHTGRITYDLLASISESMPSLWID